MSVFGCLRKKDLKAKIGLDATYLFVETSMFGPEYKGDGEYAVVGPYPDKRDWFATVKIVNGKVAKVS